MADKNRHFGFAWVAFGAAVAVHVLDEAANDFLSVYNPAVRVIRERLPFLPLPTFTFTVWLSLLVTAIVLWLALSPFAFRGARWTRLLSIPVAVLAGVLNASQHLLASVYLHRWMPGAYSSPLLLLAAVALLKNARSFPKPGR
jgi:uncharacterized protein with HXXEE motif